MIRMPCATLGIEEIADRMCRLADANSQGVEGHCDGVYLYAGGMTTPKQVVAQWKAEMTTAETTGEKR